MFKICLILLLFSYEIYSQSFAIKNYSFPWIISNSTSSKYKIQTSTNYLNKKSTGESMILQSGLWAFNNIFLLNTNNDFDLKNLPLEFKISSPYPNPFNPSIKINYELIEVSNLNISVFNIYGKKIFNYDNLSITPGKYEFNWNGVDTYGNKISSGVYLIRFNINDKIFNQKVSLIK